MPLAVLNQSKKILGPVQVYIVPYPAGGYVGATDAIRNAAVKALFYSDSATDALRLPIVPQYTEMTSAGAEIKLKQAGIEFDGQFGKYPVGNQPMEASATWEFKDADAAHLIDAFAALGTDVFTTNAAVGVAGRKTIMLGRQSNPLLVAICLRYPSEIVSGAVQEWRNVFIPMAQMSPDWSIKIGAKNVATVKQVATAIPDMSLIGAAARPPLVLMDDVTAAGT